MNALKIAAVVLLTLSLVFIGGGLLLPSGFEVKRSIRVQAPLDITFAQVNDLRNWERWSPWTGADPTLTIRYGDSSAGEGASYSWSGDNSGEGTLTITSSFPERQITTQYDFGDLGTSQSDWDFAHSSGVTEVTWTFEGENTGVLAGWFSLTMDAMIGPQFE